MPSFDYNKDPADHVPVPDTSLANLMERWGIPLDDSEALIVMKQVAAMQAGAPPTPQAKFFEKLKARKIQELENYDKSPAIPCKKDYVFELEFVACNDPQTGKPLITREFRCSGDMNLRAWAEKLLLPVMGYVRGYHTWVLLDQKDGAVFGSDAKAIDSTHMWAQGNTYILDRDWTLAHILRNVGDKVAWIYDLGDNFRHLITLVEIVPESESTGKVEFLDATGACPAEDHQGNRAWADIAHSILNGTSSPSVHEKIANATNYYHISRTAGSPRGWRLDPREFDFPRGKAGLEIALERKILRASITMQEMHRNMAREAGKSLSEIQGMEPYTDEVERKMAICGYCGRPNTDGQLRRCTKCKVAFYCGRECQIEGWGLHKATCRKLPDL